jgi:hypothetical protein
MNFIQFIQQISKSVLPDQYYNIVNCLYIRVFRLIACISIITIFFCKNIWGISPYALLFIISYIYIFYQCVIIIIKIYYVFNRVIKDDNIKHSIPICFCNTIYYTLFLLLVIWGIPFVSDTLIEIMGDIKHVIKILSKKKEK